MKAGSPRRPVLDESLIDPVFAATVQATEKAIINALVAAETMTGKSGSRASDRRVQANSGQFYWHGDKGVDR